MVNAPVVLPKESSREIKKPRIYIIYRLRQLWNNTPSANQLAETIDGKEETYWYLHGYRTGRGDERHPPPRWQWHMRGAWKRGLRDGLKSEIDEIRG